MKDIGRARHLRQLFRSIGPTNYTTQISPEKVYFIKYFRDYTFHLNFNINIVRYTIIKYTITVWVACDNCIL